MHSAQRLMQPLGKVFRQLDLQIVKIASAIQQKQNLNAGLLQIAADEQDCTHLTSEGKHAGPNSTERSSVGRSAMHNAMGDSLVEAARVSGCDFGRPRFKSMQ